MKLSRSPGFPGEMIASHTVSTPNGRHYGKEGHVPADHVAMFDYPDCTRTFDGREWKVYPFKKD